MGEWLHIQIHNGSLYVFSDNAHWRDSPREKWDEWEKITFDGLAKECCLGAAVDGRQISLRLKPQGPRIGKFGVPYLDSVDA